LHFETTEGIRKEVPVYHELGGIFFKYPVAGEGCIDCPSLWEGTFGYAGAMKF
jgi:hypothetical protein